MSLVKLGANALILSGSDSYAGGTTVSGGTLEIAAADSLPSTGLIAISGGGVLVLGSGGSIGALSGASEMLLPQATQTPLAGDAAASPIDVALSSSSDLPSASLAGTGFSEQSPVTGVSSTAAAVVPEPSSWLLAATAAICGLGWRVRRHCPGRRKTI